MHTMYVLKFHNQHMDDGLHFPFFSKSKVRDGEGNDFVITKIIECDIGVTELQK